MKTENKTSSPAGDPAGDAVRPEAEAKGCDPVSEPEADEKQAQSQRLQGRRNLKISLLIGLCCLLVYNANGRAISAGDNYPARYLPFAIGKHHTVFLDPVSRIAAQGRGKTAFWMASHPDGFIVSMYPIVVPVLIAPVYLPAVQYLNAKGWTDQRVDRVAKILEKLCASLIASLSVSLFYLLLRRRAPHPEALLLTLAYAFGTTTWCISSQALWQHGLAQLLIVGALLILQSRCSTPRAFWVGLLCGMIPCNRPPDLFLAAAVGAYALHWAGRRRALGLIVGAAVPCGLVLFYNVQVMRHVLGGYGWMVGSRFQHDLLAGLGGLLISPARGLLVYSPFLLFLALAVRYRPQDREERWLTLAMAIGAILQLLLYAKFDWRSGMSWGPRFLTDQLPFLVWMLVPVVVQLRGILRASFQVAVAVSVVIEAIGAFCYTNEVDQALFADSGRPHEMRAFWDWRKSPILQSLRLGLAPAELLLEVRGDFEAIEADGHPNGTVTSGKLAVARGWALAGHATPSHVLVVLDETRIFLSHTFFQRPDLRDTLHVTNPTGWRIQLDTTGLSPGQHTLSAFAFASANGEGAYLGERILTILPKTRP